VRSGKLYQRIRFATDVNPMAKIAYGLYSAKFLNAVSVGFLPLKWEEPATHSLSAPWGEGVGEVASSVSSAQSPISHLRSSKFSRRYVEQELLEVSAVAIPANPNALALAYKSGALEKSDLRALAALLHHTLSAGQAIPSPGGEGKPALRNAFDEGGGEGGIFTDPIRTEVPQHRSTLIPAPMLPAPRSPLLLALQLRDLLKHL